MLSQLKGFYLKINDFLESRSRKSVNVLPGCDGKLYEVRDSAIGRIVVEASYVKELDKITPGFQLRLPKIPGQLLKMTISFFRAWHDWEAMVQIFFDKEERRYFIYVPQQEVSKVAINAQFTEQFSGRYSERFIEVCQIHSHNSMMAAFSSIDDANEKKFMIYGVVGKIDQAIPEIQLRVGVNGKFIPLAVDFVFTECDLSQNSSYPHEWDEQVTVEGRG